MHHLLKGPWSMQLLCQSGVGRAFSLTATYTCYVHVTSDHQEGQKGQEVSC